MEQRDKKQAFAEAIEATAMNMVRLSKQAAPRKLPFRKIDRTPKKRMDRRRAVFALALQPFMLQAKLTQIASEPTTIPNYPKGTYGTQSGQKRY